mmetsp:Transcript_34372/g.93083  ORF Transcript_34372/g.93083 Transcript_34372/m.93083 type:complete len:262 (+) Transcript_34372:977-1762(+)
MELGAEASLQVGRLAHRPAVGRAQPEAYEEAQLAPFAAGSLRGERPPPVDDEALDVDRGLPLAADGHGQEPHQCPERPSARARGGLLEALSVLRGQVLAQPVALGGLPHDVVEPAVAPEDRVAVVGRPTVGIAEVRQERLHGFFLHQQLLLRDVEHPPSHVLYDDKDRRAQSADDSCPQRPVQPIHGPGAQEQYRKVNHRRSHEGREAYPRHRQTQSEKRERHACVHHKLPLVAQSQGAPRHVHHVGQAQDELEQVRRDAH